MCRTVTLVLLDEDGVPLGELPPFTVDDPYWSEVAAVVTGARGRFGIDVTVLRMLSAERDVPDGGGVTYLAQTDRVPDVALRGVPVDLSVHPLRAAYAMPGGPQASLRWADRTLIDLGYGTVRQVTQQRTWNLSAIWCLDTPGGPVWLKQVPRFFAHEGAVIGWIDEAGYRERVPRVIAAAGDRVLLADIPGPDRYGAGEQTCAIIAAGMHEIQVAAAGNVTELLDAGVPDRRGARLIETIVEVVASYRADHRLDRLIDGLADRMAAIEECGLPDTLVHGDLHPGNARGDDRSLVILDWGDSAIGHPGFDILRLTEGLDGPDRARLLDQWANRWRDGFPNRDPLAAVKLLAPVAALRNAAVYAGFLANIEPSEHPYHASDVPAWLARAADAEESAAIPAVQAGDEAPWVRD